MNSDKKNEPVCRLKRCDIKDDPDRVDDLYPGFATYTRCGRHCDEGIQWRETLRAEINHFNTIKQAEYRNFTNLPIEEMIETGRKMNK
jgi:hypothetical protein